MKILVTGANGFIGSQILRRLAGAEGGEVCGMVRETSDLRRLAGGGYELRFCCLEGPLEEVLRGVTAVVHAAARSSDWGRYDEFHRANVEGTGNLARAAAAAGIRRLVHISSTVVYGFSGHRWSGEDLPLRPFDHPYCLTKVAAEKALLPFRDRFHLTILRPSNVYGPGDTSFTYPLFRTLEKGLPAFPAGGKYLTSPCGAANLVAAVRQALEADCPSGEAFNISDGADLPWREFLARAAGELGAAAPHHSLPVIPLRLAAALLERVYRLARSSLPPPITAYRIAQVSRDYSFSIEKAKKVLGYDPPLTTAQALRQAVEWYRREREQRLRPGKRPAG